MLMPVTKSMPKPYSPVCQQEQMENKVVSTSEMQIKSLSVRSASFEEIYENARDEYSVGSL